MNEAAKQRVAPNVAVWALFLEAVGRLTELHGVHEAAALLASLQKELRMQDLGAGTTSGDRLN